MYPDPSFAFDARAENDPIRDARDEMDAAQIAYEHEMTLYAYDKTPANRAALVEAARKSDAAIAEYRRLVEIVTGEIPFL